MVDLNNQGGHPQANLQGGSLPSRHNLIFRRFVFVRIVIKWEHTGR